MRFQSSREKKPTFRWIPGVGNGNPVLRFHTHVLEWGSGSVVDTWAWKLPIRFWDFQPRSEHGNPALGFETRVRNLMTRFQDLLPGRSFHRFLASADSRDSTKHCSVSKWLVKAIGVFIRQIKRPLLHQIPREGDLVA